MAVLHLNEDNFGNEVLESEEVVLVDFWAEWCPPCKMLGPVIEELADEVGEGVKIAKLNIEEAKTLATEYGVMSIPTLILFKDGDEVDRIQGARPKEQIKEFIENNK